MVCLFLSLLVCLGEFYLWGNAVCAGLKLEQPRNPFLLCWLGLFALGLILIPVSFVAPLSGPMPLLLAICGLLGAPRVFDRWKSSSPSWLALMAIALFCLCIAGASAYTVWPVHQYDTDLYHAQIVRWLNAHGMPWGLGNLHSRLAHNSVWLDVAGLLDNGFWDGRSAWLMVGILVCLTGLYLLYELFYSPRMWAKVYALLVFALMLFVPESTRPNLYYDTAALNVHCIVVMEALYLYFDPQEDLKKFCDSVLIMIILATLSFMIKPLTHVTVIFSSLFAIWLMYKKGIFVWKQVVRIWIIPIFAAILWIGKNLVLSGWPLFPVPVMSVSFDWTMPREEVLWNYTAVRGYARMWNAFEGAMQHGVAYWFPAWWEHHLSKDSFRYMFLLPLLLGTVGWAVTLRRRRAPGLFALLAWQLAALAGWFCMAPDPRFGFGFAWTFGASGVALALDRRSWNARAVARGLRWATVIVAVLLAVRVGRDVRKAPHALLVPGVIPARAVAEHVLDGEGHPFVVRVPVEGDRCGNAEIPCANILPRNLCMRLPGDPGQGYRPCLP